MSFYTPHGEAGFLHADADDLARKLREGDGLMWQGDVALELRVGILTANRSGYDKQTKRYQQRGDALARRYEIWRTMEDGRDEMIGHWRLDEFDRILLDLVQMDPRSRGHVPVADRLDAADAVKDKEISDEFEAALFPIFDHGMRLVHDRTEGRMSHYQVGGHKDDPLPAE